jgi:hypothetical protein
MLFGKKNKNEKFGDCEASHPTGGGINVKIALTDRNMWLCSECLSKEKETETRTRLINTAKKIDQSIEISTDLLVAGTIPIIELKAAIDQDETIPADKKEFEFCKLCDEHVTTLEAAIFDDMAALKVKQNALRAWQTNGQASAGKLRAEERAQFTKFDVNYQPVKPKTVKSPAIRVPKKSGITEAREAREAAAKYNVDWTGVRMMAQSRKITADAAGQILAGMVAKLTETK